MDSQLRLAQMTWKEVFDRDRSGESTAELDLNELSQVWNCVLNFTFQVWDRLRSVRQFVGEKLVDEIELQDQFLPMIATLQGENARLPFQKFLSSFQTWRDSATEVVNAKNVILRLAEVDLNLLCTNFSRNLKQSSSLGRIKRRLNCSWKNCTKR